MAEAVPGAPGAGPDSQAPAAVPLGGTAPGAEQGTRTGVGPDRSGAHLVRLVLWRHGRTPWNAEHRFQGHADVPLDSVGRDQAREAARYLAAMNPAAIFSSDLIRAMQTAMPLAELTGLPVQPEKDLRERGGGVWEGLTNSEIRERYPDAYATWVPPDGEAIAVVAGRVGAVITRIAASLPDRSLAVLVSHGAAINLGMSRLLGLPEEARVLGPLDNCSWSVLGQRSDRWRLLEHNVGRLPDLDPEPVQVLAAGPEGAGAR